MDEREAIIFRTFKEECERLVGDAGSNDNGGFSEAPSDAAEKSHGRSNSANNGTYNGTYSGTCNGTIYEDAPLKTSKYLIPSNSMAEERKRDKATLKHELYTRKKYERWAEEVQKE
jgi:hypothetical protein